MNFASYEFWKILILCFISSRLILAVTRSFIPSATPTAARLCLLSTALILLASESFLTLAAFLWVILLGWCTILLQSCRPSLFRQLLFVVLLIAQLAPLFYFKYWNFVLNEVLSLDVRIPSVLIPMGLSFYTFQTIGFWVDNLRNPQPRPTFLNFLNFCSFFPQIVAGPIEKRENLLPQIENTPFKIIPENLDTALRWIILGLAYKLIVADNLGVLSDQYRIDPNNPWHVWLECLVFGIRIYFDFSGYSFIAVGLGLLFGIHLTLNFRCPYWSLNLREFWRNWHVSLGAWLRDYIYLPLGGKRVKWWAANTLIVFIVSGIWHGAGWGFLIWGLLHGIGVVVCGIRPGLLRFAPLQWLFTFIYTTFTWLFFLERDSSALLTKSLAVLNPLAYSPKMLLSTPTALANPTVTVTSCIVLLFALSLLILETLGGKRDTDPYHVARKPVVVLTLLFLTILLAPMEESSFIYFNF